MTEQRKEKRVLKTPIASKELEDLKIGDIVYLDGLLVTCRDVAHRRVVSGKRELPISLQGGAIFHAGPIVRLKKGSDSEYEMVSIGPTTSMRMESFEKEFIEKTGVKILIGKGGMGPKTAEGCKSNKAIHCIYPAGCAVLAATQVEEIEDHYWDELGMPETLWCCRVKEFGPLIVSIDTNGGSLLENNQKNFVEKKNRELAEIAAQVSFIE